jgi:hypothetical protein
VHFSQFARHSADIDWGFPWTLAPW